MNRLRSFAIAGLVLLFSAADASAQNSQPLPNQPPPLPTQPPPTQPQQVEAAPLGPTGNGTIVVSKPAIGTLDDDQLETYLERLKQRPKEFDARIKEARKSGDSKEEARLKDERSAAKSYYDSEQNRLTERRPGMMAAGIALGVVGVVSLITSAFLGLAYAVDDALGSGDDDLERAAWITLIVGGVGLGAGIPMTIIGVKRHPKEADSGSLGQREWMTANSGIKTNQGLTFKWAF